ncbi:MAG: hypothetical protein WAO76_07675, partial [Georgfuchsia sp.]
VCVPLSASGVRGTQNQYEFLFNRIEGVLMSGYASLKENLVFNALTQGVNAFLPLLIQYLIVRRLDLVDIGSLNVLFSIQALFALVVAAANLHLLVVTSREGETDDYVVVSNGTVFGLLCAIPSTLLFLVVALTSEALSARIGETAVIVAVAFSILVAPLGNSYYFQARLLNRQMFARRVVSRFALLVGILLFIEKPDDAVAYGVIFSLVMVLEYFLAYARVHRLVDLGSVTVARQKEILFGSMKYLHFNLTYGVLPHYAVVLGVGRVGEQYFAEFSVLVKIVNLVTGFITSSVMVLYPFKNSRGATPEAGQLDKRALLWTALVALLATLGLILVSKVIYILMLNRPDPVMAKEFWVLAFYVPVHAVFNYYMFNVFIYEGRHRFVILLNSATLAGFALLVVLSGMLGWGLSLSFILISTAAAALMVVVVVAATRDSRYVGASKT